MFDDLLFCRDFYSSKTLMNVFENEGRWDLQIRAVGIKKGDISVTCNDDAVFINFEKPTCLPTAGHVISQEFAIDDISGTIKFPGKITGVTAKLSDGVLFISASKAFSGTKDVVID